MCWKSNFTPTHRTIFLVMWAVFAALTFTVTAMNVPRGPDDFGQVIMATIGTLAGPMPGALSRGCQSCCLQFSLSLFPYAGAALLVAVVPQFLPWGQGQFAHAVRLWFWTVGLLGWFGTGILYRQSCPVEVVRYSDDNPLIALMLWGRSATKT